MKALNLHLALLILSYFSIFCVCAQTPNIQINSNTNGLVNYKIEKDGQQTHLFTLFGDGTFSSLQEPKHKFEPNAEGYTTEVYFAKAYDPNLPPKRTIHTGPTHSGSSYVNPTVNMTGDIDILTSWATAKDYENFYIIAFRNTTNRKLVSGTIEFHYNNNDIEVNYANIKVYNSWVTNRTTTEMSEPLNQKIKWNFTNLQKNEIRYIYVPATTLKPIGEIITIEAKYKINSSTTNSIDRFGGFGSSNSLGSATTGNFLSRGYPHDPNFMTVNKECLKLYEEQQQELIYTIGFYNDGEYFAKDVYVAAALSRHLDKNNISLVAYETKPTWSVYDGTIQFEFADIQLPGTNQTSPKEYSYEDASTYVSFKICSQSDLLKLDCISNIASIIFDQQPVFYTNTSTICPSDCTDFDVCGEQDAETNQLKSQFIESEKSDELSFNAYPNPASSHVEIDINFNSQATTNFTVRLLDYSGKIIEQLSVNDNYSNIFIKKIDLKHISSGLYFMILETEHERHNKKIIKN